MIEGSIGKEKFMSYVDKPWLKSYKLGPYKLATSLSPLPKEPVFKALDQAARKYP